MIDTTTVYDSARMGVELNTQVIGVFATLYGALMAAAPFVQAYRILKRKRAADVSVPANLFSLSGCLVWIVWGIVSKNPPIYLANLVACLSFGSVVGLTVRYGRK